MKRWWGLACLVLVAVAGAASAGETANPALSPTHRLLLAAARDLASTVAEDVWPGWGGESGVEMEVLLVTEETEVLVGGARLPAGFNKAAEDPTLGALAQRPRVFPPSLLATMPVFGPPPTIVVGGPESTERASGEWLQVLLHEHFHQWQMRAPEYYAETAALDLAGDDTSGRWMLEYPFPYDDAEIGRAFADLSAQLAVLLRRPADEDLTAEAMDVWRRFERLERSLEPDAARYLNFQLWQEGVARFVELRVAEAAAAQWRPPAALAALPDFEEAGVQACAAWERLFAELEAPDLAGNRRVSFYALGAGLALLLDRTEEQWKNRYESPRFALAPARRAD